MSGKRSRNQEGSNLCKKDAQNQDSCTNLAPPPSKRPCTERSRKLGKKEYVEQKLECAICKEVVQLPLGHQKCPNHLFCATCVARFVSERAITLKCPLCNTSWGTRRSLTAHVFHSPHPLVLKRLHWYDRKYRQVITKCPCQGCDFESPLPTQLAKHVLQCCIPTPKCKYCHKQLGRNSNRRRLIGISSQVRSDHELNECTEITCRTPNCPSRGTWLEINECHDFHVQMDELCTFLGNSELFDVFLGRVQLHWNESRMVVADRFPFLMERARESNIIVQDEPLAQRIQAFLDKEDPNHVEDGSDSDYAPSEHDQDNFLINLNASDPNHVEDGSDSSDVEFLRFVRANST